MDPEALIGLTKTGVDVHKSLMSVMWEFKPAEKPASGLDIGPDLPEPVHKILSRVWAEHGLTFSYIDAGILNMVGTWPASLDAILDVTEEELPDVPPGTVERSVESLIDAGILTQDQGAMWVGQS